MSQRFIAALALTLLVATGANAGTLILRGGAIYTLDAARPWASAVVVEDGRIVYVGDDVGAQRHVRSGAHVVDLHGRMVLPGFHDAHMHPMSGGMRLLRCRLDFKRAEQVYAAVRACAAAEPKRAWLLGTGWLPEAFGEGGPSRAKLDELVPDRPAFLTTEDGYTAWVNSKALAIAGVEVASGVVTGDAAVAIRRKTPVPSKAEYRDALRRSSAMANRFGITSVFDAAASGALVEAYHAADLAGELTLRIVAAQRIDPARGVEQIDEMVARAASAHGRRFHAGAAKIFLDEETDRHTAALLAPYADKPGARGDLFVQPDALDAIVRRLDADGFLIHMHVMGDRAVRVGLDAIERAIWANGARDRRHQLAHVGVADPADIPRFGKLGVAANFSPLWAQADDPALEGTVTALGPQRAPYMYPISSVAAAGGRIVASSDWPAPSMNPLDGIQVAVTRQPLDGRKPSFNPQERVDLAAIIAAYTRDAAWVVREEAVDGSIEVGKQADLIVLDRNLFEVDVMQVHQVRVLLTLLDGEPVYRDPHLSWR